jgi:hypothetical protein
MQREEAMRVGTCGVFLGYEDRHPDVEAVFERGDLCVMIAPDDEGVFRCAALSTAGAVARWRTDTIFAEEVVWLNQAPLVAEAGAVAR